jgi:CheY-like chemotaxis protein
MKLLLVEDDEFKATDIAKVLADSLPGALVERATSVTSALRAMTKDRFSLVLLDMSLPTFDLSGPGGGGSPQGQGGVEVLRLAHRLENRSSFVIVTQYPDVEIDGHDVPLSRAARALRSRFHVDVKDCILYEFDGDTWREPLRDCLRSLPSATKSGDRT